MSHTMPKCVTFVTFTGSVSDVKTGRSATNYSGDRHTAADDTGDGTVTDMTGEAVTFETRLRLPLTSPSRAPPPDQNSRSSSSSSGSSSSSSRPPSDLHRRRPEPGGNQHHRPRHQLHQHVPGAGALHSGRGPGCGGGRQDLAGRAR